MKNSFLLIIIALFIVLSVIFLWLGNTYPSFSFPVLMSGNGIMALLSLFSYFVVKKQMKERPQAFVRGVYTATYTKLLVCMAAILIYALLYRRSIYKPTLFVLFGVYAVYTILETALLQKLARKEK